MGDRQIEIIANDSHNVVVLAIFRVFVNYIWKGALCLIWDWFCPDNSSRSLLSDFWLSSVYQTLRQLVISSGQTRAKANLLLVWANRLVKYEGIQKEVVLWSRNRSTQKAQEKELILHSHCDYSTLHSWRTHVKNPSTSLRLPMNGYSSFYKKSVLHNLNFSLKENHNRAKLLQVENEAVWFNNFE